LHCSAPHQNGEIVNHCNHLHFEEDDQFIGGSTAVFRFIHQCAPMKMIPGHPYKAGHPDRHLSGARRRKRQFAKHFMNLKQNLVGPRGGQRKLQ
jgi:hypothetical protein